MALIVRGTSFATFASGNFFRKVQKSWPSNRGLHRLSALEKASKKSYANGRTGRLLHRFNRGPPARTQNQNSLARGAAQNSGLTDEWSQRDVALCLRLARPTRLVGRRPRGRNDPPLGCRRQPRPAGRSGDERHTVAQRLASYDEPSWCCCAWAKSLQRPCHRLASLDEIGGRNYLAVDRGQVDRIGYGWPKGLHEINRQSGSPKSIATPALAFLKVLSERRSM